MSRLSRAILLMLVYSAVVTPAARAADAPFSSTAWSIHAQTHRVEMFDGRETLYLASGRATLEEVEFLNGIIAFDVMVPPERGFAGVRWRVQDADNYEDFYIRPHQSGNPDANQYQPVFNGVAGWQIYFGPEYSVPISYKNDEWIPIRIEVLDGRAQMAVGGDAPDLVVDLIRDPMSGGIGVSSGYAPARFSNFRYELTDEIDIAALDNASNRGRSSKAEGLVTRWMISDAIEEALVAGVTRLDESLLAGLGWHALDVEANGIANMARIQGNRGGTNTAFARISLEADGETVQPLDFGFSDRVRVFVNGALVYSGSDMWQSRDYRFLGTVGMYGTVYCHLAPGRNEVLLAVSESFGGWAVVGALSPVDGVRLLDE